MKTTNLALLKHRECKLPALPPFPPITSTCAGSIHRPAVPGVGLMAWPGACGPAEGVLPDDALCLLNGSAKASKRPPQTSGASLTTLRETRHCLVRSRTHPVATRSRLIVPWALAWLSNPFAARQRICNRMCRHMCVVDLYRIDSFPFPCNASSDGDPRSPRSPPLGLALAPGLVGC